MEFSTQLRLILLVVGVLALVWMYLLGKRHGRAQQSVPDEARHDRTTVQDFGEATALDEDELDTPAYLRRGAAEGTRQAQPLPTVTVSAQQWRDEFEGEDLPSSVYDNQGEAGAPLEDNGPRGVSAVATAQTTSRTEPGLSDDSFAAWPESSHDEPTLHAGAGDVTQPEPITEPVDVPVINLSDSVAITPTTSTYDIKDVPVIEQTVPAPQTQPEPESPTPITATQPKPASPAAKRKIVALRLSVPARVSGEQLLSLFQRDNLQHGRFGIFHRLQDDVSVFSIASMVEPGSFDLSAMRDQQFPGVTFFMLLPGPLDGLVAYDQMLSCAQRMANATDGLLQDERGHKLSSATIERLREEVLDFQHLLGNLDVISG